MVIRIFLLILLLQDTPSAHAQQNSPEQSRLLVHLLDYVAVDYRGAVQNGKILEESEYKEQQEFILKALDLSRTLPGIRDSFEIQALVSNVDGLVKSKADPALVAAAARNAQAKVIALSGLSVTPLVWPNISAGGRLFQKNCTKCHGPDGRGDDPAAPTLATKPANFQNPKMMLEMTPFQIFNTIRLGVPNTPMAAFPSFSDKDTWNLAFLVLSLRYQKVQLPDDERIFERAKSTLATSQEKALAVVATSSDSSLGEMLQGDSEEREYEVAALRLHSVTSSAQSSLEYARSNIAGAVDDYVSKRFDQASEKALKAYIEGVEPVEPRLKASDPQAVYHLEQLMQQVRSLIASRSSGDEVRLAGQKAIAALDAASGLLQTSAPTPWLTFVLSFGILIREGFEAVLLIVALLSVIGASGAAKGRWWVHAGWLTAVGFGLVAWFVSGAILSISGLSRELMEAITGLLTVVVLLYVGFWLHSRTEISRWKSFIKQRVKSALEERNLLQLAFISFLAAFREVLETVLFLRAIWLEGGANTRTSLGLGVAASFAAILIMGWLILKFSARLPIRSLFNVSSIVMIGLSVIVVGKALHSFQEINLLPAHLSPIPLRWDWLGLYPTRETMMGQLLILAASVFFWSYGKRPPAEVPQD